MPCSVDDVILNIFGSCSEGMANMYYHQWISSSIWWGQVPSVAVSLLHILECSPWDRLPE